MPFTAFPSIESFAHAVKAMRREDGFDAPTVSYGAKIKLHGTNGGIRIESGQAVAQSRSRDITPQDDNAGFAAFVEASADFWRSRDVPDGTVFFGEWAGPGIQKGDAITQIPGKIFFVFAVRTPEAYITEPLAILDAIGDRGAVPVFVLPWLLSDVQINFASNDALTAQAEQFSGLAEQIGIRDPFVADEFGVEGPGEGMVFMPHGFVWAGGGFGRVAFKVKCEAHRVRKVKAAASVGFEISDDVVAFAKSFVTEARCAQALAESCGGIADKRKTPDFLKWIGGDIKKESAAELEAMGCDWKQIAPIVTREAVQWWLSRCEQVPA